MILDPETSGDVVGTAEKEESNFHCSGLDLWINIEVNQERRGQADSSTLTSSLLQNREKIHTNE